MYLMNMVQLGGNKVAPTRVPIHGLSNLKREQKCNQLTVTRKKLTLKALEHL